VDELKKKNEYLLIVNSPKGTDRRKGKKRRKAVREGWGSGVGGPSKGESRGAVCPLSPEEKSQ